MPRKKKPYMVFETKEEFDKMWKDIVDKAEDHARVEGFKDGCTWVLSYTQELFQDMFKPEAFAKAEQEIRDRHIEAWRREKDAESLKFKLDRKHLFDEKLA